MGQGIISKNSSWNDSVNFYLLGKKMSWSWESFGLSMSENCDELGTCNSLHCEFRISFSDLSFNWNFQLSGNHELNYNCWIHWIICVSLALPLFIFPWILVISLNLQGVRFPSQLYPWLQCLSAVLIFIKSLKCPAIWSLRYSILGYS